MDVPPSGNPRLSLPLRPRGGKRTLMGDGCGRASFRVAAIGLEEIDNFCIPQVN